MATKKQKRLPDEIVQKDLTAFTAFGNLTAYSPNNMAFAAPNVTSAFAELNMSRAAEKTAEDAANKARDAADLAERKYHDIMLGVIDQVRSQYGKDSDELASMGLKKKSEYKAPSRKPKNTA